MMIFHVAEVQRRKQFLQADNLSSFLSGLANTVDSFLDVALDIGSATHLD
jgi:hypothetical protein